MNKKGIIKVSTIILILALLLFLILSSFFGSAASQESYVIGEEIKIDLSSYEPCILKIQTPSGNENQYNCEDKFFLKFEESGEYILDIESEDSLKRLEFQVDSAGTNLEENAPSIKEETGKIPNEEKGLDNLNKSDLIIIGEPVRNYENLSLDEQQTIKIKVPESAEEISIKDNLGEEVIFKEEDTVVDSIKNALNDVNEKSVVILNAEGEINIEYLTPGPEKIEKEISEDQKQVKVFSEEGLHYKNVLSYTELPREVYNSSLIRVYWVDNQTYLDFEAKDINGNGLIDYVEWVVPHLSEQTFEIILIEKAEHFSSNGEFVSDIYEQVKELDNIWSETINENEYVRVTFETPLDSTKDITIYPRIISGNPSIVVYEKKGSNPIAEFSNLTSNEYNKVFLINLQESQSTFDLKVIGGSLEIDHIIDPQTIYNVNSSKRAVWGQPTSRNRWIAGTNSTASQYANMATENNVYASVSPTSNNDYPFYRFNFTINEAVATISSLYIKFTGYDNAAEAGTIYIWRFANSTWMPIGTTPSSNGNVTRNITSDFNSYIDADKQMVILVEGNQYDISPSADYLYIDYIGVTVQYSSDLISPTYKQISVNNTIPEEVAKFSINVTDNIALHPQGGYIFSTNNSGSWVNDSFVSFAITPSWANVTKTLISTAETFVGYMWYFNDTQGNTNSTPIYILTTSSYPPSGAQIECEEAGSWKDCNEVEFSEILTRVRINCTGNVINASFNLTNIPDSYTFFNSNATLNETTWWIYDNPDLIINDSGKFYLSGTCYGPSSQSRTFVNWTVPWGNLIVDLISPYLNINVNPNKFFDFTTNVTCVGGECGSVNVTLDPADSWWNINYENRKPINITNPSSSILTQNYSINLVLDTTGIDFQDDGDDLRIIYWNGSHNLELDRFNDSFFNITTTSVWFRIQSNISPESYDDNYYIYYNNSYASNPLNNGSRVFEFFDNFNRANSTTIGNGWTETTGTWEIINNWVRNTMNGDSDLTRTTLTGNHSIRVIANQVVTDADLKLSLRSALSPTGGYTFGYQNDVLELTSGNHNTANLGSVPTSTTAGIPYELEINAFRDRITTYKDGMLVFNVTSTAAYSGFTLLHSWDVSEFDDFWVRQLIDIEPTYSIGNAEKVSKAIISTTEGAIPFYTTSNNPMDYIGTSCLFNMKSGTTCNVTWQVNATGRLGSIWNFFAYANTTQYTDYFNSSDISSSINITIGNLPPTTPELNFPANNSALTSIEEFNWSNSADPTGDSIYYIIEISNSSDFTYLNYANYNITEMAEITGVTPIGITKDGIYYWRVLATDLKSNSSWSETRIFYYDLSNPLVNLISPDNMYKNTYSNTIDFIFNVSDLSNIESCNLIVNDSIKDTSMNVAKDINSTFSFYLQNSFYSWKINCTDSAGRVGDSETRFLDVSVSNNPPFAREIQCEKENNWYNCTSIAFGDTITKVRVKCIDPEEEVTNASINMTNLPDSYTHFSNFTVDSDSEGYWTFDNLDITINDSGDFRIMATCYDNESLSKTNFTTWTVPWGSLAITLLNPNSDTSVMKNSFFTFSSRVNCINGECGSINVTLDPPNWWNESWDYRETINITNSGSTTLNNFPIYIDLPKELEMQADFDDIRFVSGSCGSTGTYVPLNYEIENYTSSKAEVWVNVPSFTSGINQICMYYGNSLTSSGQNSINTWNYNYQTVQHLEEVGTGTRYDSLYLRNFTTSGYNGDEKVTGMVGSADNLDGVNDALNSTSNFLSNQGSFTIEGWIKPLAWGSRISLIGQNDALEFFLDGSNTIMFWTSGGGSASASYPYSLNSWHHIVAVGTGSSLILYFDGTQVVSGGTSTTNYGSSAYPVKIGEGVVDATGGFFNGSMDEVRISNISRSADWISQSYQIVNNQDGLVFFGTKEEKTKGIISTIIGAIPFYTTTSNPLNSSTTSCLAGMKSSGGSCDVNWSVNATGELNSIWEFFVSANNLDYKDYSNISAESSRIIITIASQVSPSVPQLYRPLNATAHSSVPNLNWTNSTDPNGDKIYYILEISNVSDFSTIIFSNSSIPETANPTNKLPTGITQEGAYYWRVRATDLIGNSSWSEKRIFYYDLSAPEITFINQTGEDNRIINSSNLLNQGENISIFVNISDVNTDKVWTIVWQSIIGGVAKVKIFFTNLGNSLWKANVPTNQTFNGIYNYTVYANDTLGSQINYSSNFTVLGGNASISITPSNVDSIRNITVYGHINLANTTSLSNYPINLWIDGSLLSLSNLTGEGGTYDFGKEFQETSSTEFSLGSFYHAEIQNNQNITLSSGMTSGNFTKILDAGAIVSWNNVSWNSQGASCSGTFSYQEGDFNSYSNTKDAYITSGSPTTNYGSNAAIIIDGSPTSDRGLIKFDNLIGRAFYQIPENSTINNANLTFYASDTGDQVSVYQVLENWTENEVTYNTRLVGTPWGSVGCSSSPSRLTALEDSFTASSVGAYTINVTNSMKSWVVNSPNYGWVFNMPTSNGISIRSSEHSVQAERPHLMVNYQADECTNIIVYVRTSNDKLTWTPWQQISNGGLINNSNVYSRYLEYRVELTSVNSTLTPVLEDIAVNYTATVTDSNGDYRYNFTNPAQFGNHQIRVNTSFKTILISNFSNLYVETGVAPNVYPIFPNVNQWFSYGNMNLTYNVTDVNNDFAFSELIINGIVNQTNFTNIVNYAYNNFTINFTSGQYNWTVNVTDNSGYKATTAQRTFYVDLIDPNISLIYPENKSALELNQLNLSFNATDNMDTNLTCNVFLDGIAIRSGIGAASGEIINVSSGIISGGVHYWNVSCTDNAMRTFASSIFNFNISDTPPNVTLVYPNQNHLDNNGIISFMYNVTDNTGLTNCSLYINEVFNQTNSSAILNYQNNAFDVEGILEGNYNWTVECFDLSANSYKSPHRNFSMDLYKPTIVLSSPTNFSVSLFSSVVFNFTASDTFDSSLDCNLTVNGIVKDVFSANSGDLISKPLYNLTDGLKYWNVICTDDALNLNTSATWTTNITESPTILLKTLNNSRSNQTFINLNYQPFDNTNLSSCKLYINNLLNQSNSTEILNNQQNTFIVNGIQEGNYNWYVNCTDYMGISNQSETRIFYIDSTPPAIVVDYPNGEDVYASNISFNFTVTDNIESNISCNITVNSSVLDVNFTAFNGSITSRIIAGIEDGYNVWNVTCWDLSGNINVSQIFNFTRYTNPQVTLNSPENNTWFNSGEFNLTYFPEDDVQIVGASLFVNGVFNRTNSTPILNRGYNIFEITGFSDGIYSWNVNVTDPTGLTGVGSERRVYIDSHTPSIKLNSPVESEVISANNVSFNFTIGDNLDEYLDCNFTLDGELESSGMYANNSMVIKSSILADGYHSWNVNCVDNALNANYSESINFSIEAPPNVTLNSPANNMRTINSSIIFYYTPIDPIGISNCDIYLDNVYNTTKTDILLFANQTGRVNNFTIQGISEGMHSWTVNCTDSDSNYYGPSANIFYRDISPPSIILNSPSNESGIDYNKDRIYFNWTATDSLDTILQCNLTVDGIVREKNVWMTNNSPIRKYVFTSVLGQGEHFWNAICWDQLENFNVSELRKFNLTYPDFFINNSEIFLNETTVRENQSVKIIATVHNLAGADVENITVSFYNENPDLGGTKIGETHLINLSKFNKTNVTQTWSSQIGLSSIFVLIDSPLSTNGSFIELNESNNEGSKNINVGSWQLFYGDVLTSSNLVLANSLESKLINWDANNFETGNIYVADYDSYISWNQLQSIGKKEFGGDSSSDFEEIDLILNSSKYEDSVYLTYTNSGIIKNTSTIYSFKKFIEGVPIVNSANNSNFVTGIFWDYSDDSSNNEEFDSTDKEDLVFVAPINKHAEGEYGNYDYEIKIPAKLREYNKADLRTASFYVEIS